MARLDESEIYKWFDLFKGNNQLTEIRLIGTNKTASGYFTNPTTLINAIRPYSDDYNIYFTVNRIHESCYGREQKDVIIQRPKNTTTDAEITGRDWVFLDLDSKRITGTNATEEQVAKTKAKAREVYKFLRDNGFNPPIVVFSSNGVHFYLKCALKPSEENDELIKRFIQSMAMLFSDDDVDIDLKVYNRSRIARLPGSYSCKGSKHDKNMPQRKCYIVKAPAEIKVNEREYFEKIASLYPEETVTPNKDNNYSTEKFDLDGFLQKHNINVKRIENVAGGKKYILDHCFFNEQHKGKDAVIFQRDSGAIAYHCFHSSCADKKWRDVRLMFEPDAYSVKSKRDNQFHANRQYPQPKAFVPVQESDEKGKKWLCMKDIRRVDISQMVSIPTGYTELDKKIVGLFAGELTILSGLNASGKTSWLDCLALNVAQRGFKTAIWSGEMQDWRFKGWINQMAAGKNYVKKKEGYENLYYAPNLICDKIEAWLDNKLYLYNNDYGSKWEQIFSDVKEIVEKENIQLVILDNLAALCIDGYDGEKYSKQTKFILDAKDYAKQKNIHIILVAHPRKQNDFLRKESISGTADLTNIADNVFLCHRVGRDFEKRASEFFGADEVSKYLQYSAVLEVAKNRQFGIVDYLVGMYYESESRRLKNTVAEHIRYGWEENPVEQNLYDISPNTDFETSQYEGEDMPDF